MAEIPILMNHDYSRPFGWFQIIPSAPGVNSLYELLATGQFTLEPSFIRIKGRFNLLEVSVVPDVERATPEAADASEEAIELFRLRAIESAAQRFVDAGSAMRQMNSPQWDAYIRLKALFHGGVALSINPPARSAPVACFICGGDNGRVCACHDGQGQPCDMVCNEPTKPAPAASTPIEP